MNNLRLTSLFVAAVAAGALAGCGGADDAPATPAPAPAPIPATSAVPETANFSVAGFIGYLKLLTASTGADTLEPVDASKLVPPVSDTEEPAPLS